VPVLSLPLSLSLSLSLSQLPSSPVNNGDAVMFARKEQDWLLERKRERNSEEQRYAEEGGGGK